MAPTATVGADGRARRERGVAEPGPEEQLADERELWRRFAATATRRSARSWCAATCAFAKSLALRYRGASESFDDLLQVASLGLRQRVDRFDPERGIPFTRLRLADHPRRAEAPFPRPRLDRAGAARPARPHGRSRQSDLGADREAAALAVGRRDRRAGSELEPTDVLEVLEANHNRRPLSLDRPAGGDDAEESPAVGVGRRRGRGLRAGRGQARARRGPAPPRRARAAGPAAALRRGHDPVADRRADRPLADARLADPAPRPGADPRADRGGREERG